MRSGSIRRPLSALCTLLLLAACLMGYPPQARASQTPPPELLITEIVPASKGTGQPYEYVELYNPTTEPISLENYQLQYFTSSPYTQPGNRWTIRGAIIQPQQPLVLWLKKYDYPNVPLADFNQNYGVNLEPEQVFEVRLTTSAQGLHDSAKRRVGLARPDGTLVTAAYINDGVADGTGNANLSITYRYADQIDMAKVANGQVASPGSLLPGQDPLAPPDPTDPTEPTDPTDPQEPSGLPQVLITELVPDTANHYAGLDAFEFIELYNTSLEPLSLQGYTLRVQGASPTSGWEVTLSEPLTLQPRSTALLWPRRGELAEIPQEAFNLYYFADYPDRYLAEEQLLIIENVPGLVNGTVQTVLLRDPAGTEVVRATYNESGKETAQDQSIIFAPPQAGATQMRKLRAGNAPTPGLLLTEQLPPSADTQSPASPVHLVATPGYGEVNLTWDPVADPDLAAYQIYRDGQWELRVPASATSATLSLLTGGVSYTFTVTAVDLAGNESVPSATVEATPLHQVITQQERNQTAPAPKYTDFLHLSQQGPVVPGLQEDLIPQAIAYWPAQDWLILSNYLKDKRPSVLTILDASSGALVKSLHLYQEDGAPYVGHAGGIALSESHLWVASGGQVYWLPLTDLEGAPDGGQVNFGGRFQVVTNGSFATYEEGILWVGEFYHPPSYVTDPSHRLINRDGTEYNAWVAGYRLNPADLMAEGASGRATPDYLLSIPNTIQGMAFTEQSIILSQSYGRNNDATLFRYTRPDLDAEPHRFVPLHGQQIPLWFLDGQNLAPVLGVLPVPPLSEGATLVGEGQLYLLFESGANEFFHTAFSPLERLQVVDLTQWERYGRLQVVGLPEVMAVGEVASLQVHMERGNQPPIDLTGQVQISISDPAVLETTATGQLVARSEGQAQVTVTYGGQQVKAWVTVATLQALLLQELPAELRVGESIQVRVIALLSDGSQRVVTEQATLSARLGGRLQIEPNGLVTGLKPGIVALTAHYQGLTSPEVRTLIHPANR